MRRRVGLTLIEVILAVALLAMGVLFVASIIPTSVMSLKKAEDLQAASAYALKIVENLRLHPPAGPDTQGGVVTLNRTEFRFSYEVLPVEEGLFDIVVVMTGRPDSPPFRLATRVNGQLGEE